MTRRRFTPFQEASSVQNLLLFSFQLSKTMKQSEVCSFNTYIFWAFHLRQRESSSGGRWHFTSYLALLKMLWNRCDIEYITLYWWGCCCSLVISIFKAVLRSDMYFLCPSQAVMSHRFALCVKTCKSLQISPYLNQTQWFCTGARLILDLWCRYQRSRADINTPTPASLLHYTLHKKDNI